MPLKSITDAEYPRRERDFVDLAKVEPFLGDAAKIALLDSLDIYEDGKVLPQPRIASTRMSLESDASFRDYDTPWRMCWGRGCPTAKRCTGSRASWTCCSNIPSVPTARTSPFMRPSTGLRYTRSPRSSFSRRAASPAPMSSKAMRAWCIWIPAGSTPPDASSSWAFSTSWMAPTICCFCFVLVIPFRRVRPLIPIVTAFTVAHSITLIASTYHYVPDVQWFPPLIETLIALSIFYMALENIVVQRPLHRWIITFCFGLVHGFGFSFGLQHSLQFAGSHLLTSLLSFNVGVELGQLLVLCLFVPALNLLYRHVVAERMGIIIVSAIVAHQAWHWMVDRFACSSSFLGLASRPPAYLALCAGCPPRW
jgi:hypothetical protein